MGAVIKRRKPCFSNAFFLAASRRSLSGVRGLLLLTVFFLSYAAADISWAETDEPTIRPEVISSNQESSVTVSFSEIDSLLDEIVEISRLVSGATTRERRRIEAKLSSNTVTIAKVMPVIGEKEKVLPPQIVPREIQLLGDVQTGFAGARMVASYGPKGSTLDLKRTLIDPAESLLVKAGVGYFRITREGGLVVAGVDDARIYLFDSDLRLKSVMGSRGEEPGQFRSVSSVAVSPGRIYVADSILNRITTFDDSGSVLFTYDRESKDSPAEFKSIAVSGDRIYVLDRLNEKVYILSAADGKTLGSFGSPGAGAGQFRGPSCLAVDSKGRIFVADTLNDRIQIFDLDGKLEVIRHSGIRLPTFITLDPYDNLFVLSDKILRIGPSGYLLDEWDRVIPVDDGYYFFGREIESRSWGRIFVSDLLFNNILEYFYR